MTEQKPVAWICEYRSGWSPRNWLTDVSEHRPKECETIRNVRPLYEYPPAPVDAKPVAWAWNYGLPAIGGTLRPMCTPFDPRERHDHTLVHDVRPLYEYPPAPAAPVTTPEVEAARRKALGAILKTLAEYEWACDTAHVVGFQGPVTFGCLRDLVGQPRKDPARRISGYDDTPTGQVPEPPPARLSVEYLASVIANNGVTRVDPTRQWVVNIAKAVHEAVYGRGA